MHSCRSFSGHSCVPHTPYFDSLNHIKLNKQNKCAIGWGKIQAMKLQCDVRLYKAAWLQHVNALLKRDWNIAIRQNQNISATCCLFQTNLTVAVVRKMVIKSNVQFKYWGSNLMLTFCEITKETVFLTFFLKHFADERILNFISKLFTPLTSKCVFCWVLTLSSLQERQRRYLSLSPWDKATLGLVGLKYTHTHTHTDAQPRQPC